ncbi:MAG: phosphoribosylaminoimidazolesuccinocarboxamide synthase [Chitinophagaceae bacterium]|nr:phosphoribosylaminoimidazolesuccinocarboxamide synthase [Chitinophagaceae bacterium]
MEFKYQTGYYQGKVRNVHYIGEEYLVMVASNRISAFDVILPKPIPYKGQVLNQIAASFLKATVDIVPNWVLATPLPHVSVGLKCQPFPVEMVIRGYLTGHASRTYTKGIRTLCGVQLPEGLRENDAFPEPIITPTTKAHEGHDQDISREEIIAKGLVSESDYVQIESITRKLYARGQSIAQSRGLILVDTKYEFGKIGDTIYLMDEIHTPDSSRYFYAEGYEELQQKGLPQKQLSKEFVREWLLANHFMGLEGQQIPEIPDDFVQEISERYIELYQQVTGRQFEPNLVNDAETLLAVNAWIDTVLSGK